MDVLDLIGVKTVKFVLKFWLFSFIAIVCILFCTIIYCYIRTYSSVNIVLPQIARLVAEEGCLDINEDISGASAFNSVCDTFENINNENNGKVLKYYIPSKSDFIGNSNVNGKLPAIRVYKVKNDGTVDESRNLYDHTNGNLHVNRGELVEIQVTAYILINTNVKFNDDYFFRKEYPITKKMRVVGIKYYRG